MTYDNKFKEHAASLPSEFERELGRQKGDLMGKNKRYGFNEFTDVPYKQQPSVAKAALSSLSGNILHRCLLFDREFTTCEEQFSEFEPECFFVVSAVVRGFDFAEIQFSMDKVAPRTFRVFDLSMRTIRAATSAEKAAQKFNQEVFEQFGEFFKFEFVLV